MYKLLGYKGRKHRTTNQLTYMSIINHHPVPVAMNTKRRDKPCRYVVCTKMSLLPVYFEIIIIHNSKETIAYQHITKGAQSLHADLAPLVCEKDIFESFVNHGVHFLQPWRDNDKQKI